jgi:uncharacterized glyoxalase superfamily protein PhnB
LDLEGGVVMVEGGDKAYRNPSALKQTCCSIVFFVRDVDQHYLRAKAAGAKITLEPTERPWGLRQYRAQDIEGHAWEFTQHIRDVPPEAWGATVPKR